MKKFAIMLLSSALVVAPGCRRKESPPVAAKIELSAAVYPPDSDYPIQPKAFSEVTVKDNFWTPKMKLNAEVTIPHVMKKSSGTGRGMSGNVLQAAINSLQTYPDPQLQAEVDSRIQAIKTAQEEKISDSNGLFEFADGLLCRDGQEGSTG